VVEYGVWGSQTALEVHIMAATLDYIEFVCGGKSPENGDFAAIVVSFLQNCQKNINNSNIYLHL
jgi:hypothetical protein